MWGRDEAPSDLVLELADSKQRASPGASFRQVQHVRSAFEVGERTAGENLSATPDRQRFP